jgi:choline dehydrogenase-like flavoprotein
MGNEMDRTDALVVGSGFGGAVAACRLAQAGFSVRVLERGRRYGPGDFPALPDPRHLLPDFGRWTWKHDQGLWDIVDLGEVVSVQAAGYGGGSLIYANVHLKPPDAVFDNRWPSFYQKPDNLSEYFDLAAYMLDVAPITEHQRGGKFHLTKVEQLEKAVTNLGRRDAFFYPPLAVSRTGKNDHGKDQKPCTGCGACCSGCPEGAKNTLDYNYLAIAEKHGASVQTQCEVVDLLRRGRGWAVKCVDHLRAETHERFEADFLFLCAGSVHSTRLVARAKLESVCKQVGVGYFPGGDAIGVAYDTATPQYPSAGPTITTSTVSYERPEDPGSFFLVQDGGYAKDLERLIGILRAPAWVGRNRLTADGPGTVSPGAAPTNPAFLNPVTDHGVPLVSPVDAIFDALGQSDLSRAFSPRMRADASRFLEELKKPLLLPDVVDSTIEQSIRARFERWWLRWAKPFIRPLMWIELHIVRWLYGTPDKLANRAIHAALTAGGLPRKDVARKVLNYDAGNADRRAMLLAMGRDAASGVLHYDEKLDRLYADLDLYHLAPGYRNEELLMTDISKQLGGELRTNPAWAFLGKPITVHNQGGCAMSDLSKDGVTDPQGKVHGVEGLYVMDGALLCTSVGVNPSATIAAIAERNVLAFIREQRHDPKWPEGDTRDGARQYAQQRDAAGNWAADAAAKRYQRTPPLVPPTPYGSVPLGLKFTETMQGYYWATDEAPGDNDARYRELEMKGCPEYPIEVTLTASVENLAAFFEDENHEMQISGSAQLLLPGSPSSAPVSSAPLEVTGNLNLFVPRYKPYAITDPVRLAAHERLIGGKRKYTTLLGPPPPPHELPLNLQRFLRYSLHFSGPDGRSWTIDGYKRVRDDPGADAWRDTSSLFVMIHEGTSAGSKVRGAGVVHMDLAGFLFGQIPSFEVTGTDDAARRTWAIAKFATFFFGSLQRIYLPGAALAFDTFFRIHPDNVLYQTPFPPR